MASPRILAETSAVKEAVRAEKVDLDEADRKALTVWACDCAEHVLTCFERACPGDDRPRNAVETGRAWARGEIELRDVRAAAFGAHAAARGVADPSGRAAARAAGHAAATAHVPEHAHHAAAYALRAVTRAGRSAGAASCARTERDWQVRRLPKALHSLVFRG